jgi:hypothetical protein
LRPGLLFGHCLLCAACPQVYLSSRERESGPEVTGTFVSHPALIFR